MLNRLKEIYVGGEDDLTTNQNETPTQGQTYTTEFEDRVFPVQGISEKTETDKYLWKSSVPAGSRFVSKFFSEHSKMKDRLEEIQGKRLKKFKEACERFGSLYGKKRQRAFNKIKKTRKKITFDLSEIRAYLSTMRNELKGIEGNLERDYSGASAEYRMKKNLYNSLLKRLSLVLHDFQLIVRKLDDDYTAEVERKLEIINQNLDSSSTSKDTEDAILKSVQLCDMSNVFGLALSGKSSIAVEYQVAHEMNMQLVRLDEMMTELVDMFMDVKTMVDRAELLVGSIEENVMGSGKSVRRGREMVRRAAGKRKKERRGRGILKKLVKRMFFGKI